MEINPIGIIHSPYKNKSDAPFQGRMNNVETVLEIYPEYVDGLLSIEERKHIIVLYWQHLSKRDILRHVTPWGPELRGVFSTRTPNRPNPIAFCVADLIKVDGNKLYVKGVDALDGSYLLDVKPYVYELDSIKGPDDILL
jgi:tRNA-Thr(GGU) m(6)t(6)A37 methyltransferase TsaA